MFFRYLIEYIFLLILLSLCKVLPINITYKIFNFIGLLCFYLLKKRRNLVLKNLDIAFPKYKFEKKKMIAKNSFKYLSEIIAFNLLFLCNKIDKNKLFDSVNVEGLEKFKRLVDRSDQNLILITAHIGNWEGLSHYTAFNTSKQINVIARKINNPLIEKKLIYPMRKKSNINIFPKKNAILPILKSLKRGQIAGILIDQKLNDDLHVKAMFFDKAVKCTPLPAVLQVKYNIPVMPVYMIRKSIGKYKLIYDDPIIWKNSNLPEDQQIKNLTQIYQNYIEKIIKLYPSQWLWMHDRWDIKRK